jgi:hypothetical protein
VEQFIPAPLTSDDVVVLVSHDSGGAELLSSWIRSNPEQKYKLVVEGPAREVFIRKKVLNHEMDIESAIQSGNWVLTGSSWGSELEISAIKLANREEKYIVTFLDHWVNYRSRLTRNGKLNLPDEIWVGDRYAYMVAINELPTELRKKIVGNPYFEDSLSQLKQLSATSQIDGIKVLYLCENISGHAANVEGNEAGWGYTEYDALKYFFDKVKGECIDHITVRPHPSDPDGKYEFIFGMGLENLSVANKTEPLIVQISQHDWIVGCNTTAMVLSSLAGKRTISCIPPGGRKCVLPHENIEHWV